MLLLIAGMKNLEERENFSVLKQAFEAQGIPISAHRYKREDGEVYYVKIGDENLPTLLLIHGSPGDWTAWKQLILTTDLVKNYQLIVPDRPGYQASTVGGGSLAVQSKALALLMQENCRPCVVAGHSYGGALALQLTVDFPEQVAAVVSLAGTVAAARQQPKWYNFLAKNKAVQAVLSAGFLASNQEMMSLSKDLLALEQKLNTLAQPFYFFQGGKDVLVAPASPFFHLDQINNLTLKYNSEWDHFVIWSEREQVAAFLTGINLENKHLLSR